MRLHIEVSPILVHLNVREIDFHSAQFVKSGFVVEKRQYLFGALWEAQFP